MSFLCYASRPFRFSYDSRFLLFILVIICSFTHPIYILELSKSSIFFFCPCNLIALEHLSSSTQHMHLHSILGFWDQTNLEFSSSLFSQVVFSMILFLPKKYCWVFFLVFLFSTALQMGKEVCFYFFFFETRSCYEAQTVSNLLLSS